MRFRLSRLFVCVALSLGFLVFLVASVRHGQHGSWSHRKNAEADAPLDALTDSNTAPSANLLSSDRADGTQKEKGGRPREVKDVDSNRYGVPNDRSLRKHVDESTERLHRIVSLKTAANETWQSSDRVVVTGRMDYEDTSWVAEELPDWQHAVYTIAPADESQHPLRTRINKGREATVYLTYIIEHYESLPTIMAFIHPHARGFPAAWHTDTPNHSISQGLNNLSLDYVNITGYTNLRCLANPGCDRDNQVHVASPRQGHSPETYMASAWADLFAGVGRGQESELGMPEMISTQCCAQFAVARWQVHARPRAAYEQYRDWLLHTDLDDADSGRVFEFLWHIIFGQPAQNCLWATHIQCRCAVYNKVCPVPPGENFKGYSKEDLAWSL